MYLIRKLCDGQYFWLVTMLQKMKNKLCSRGGPLFLGAPVRPNMLNMPKSASGVLNSKCSKLHNVGNNVSMAPVGRCNEYWQWLQIPLENKRQVLRNSRPRYQDCWHTNLVG